MNERTVRVRLKEVAEKTFGWERLRPGQREAMQELVDGHDVLLVSPTGSGKSAVYQVPAQLLPGPTVVISPLIALQRDQVAGLREVDAGGAVTVDSAQPDSRSEESLDDNDRCGAEPEEEPGRGPFALHAEVSHVQWGTGW